MTPDPIFVERYFDEEFWNWKYQYYCDEFSRSNEEELYEWCLANLGANIDWHVRWHGVIIRLEEMAMAFKLTWM